MQPQLMEQIIAVRQRDRLKLPDAIIVATAMQSNAILVTADQQLKSLPGLWTINLSE